MRFMLTFRIPPGEGNAAAKDGRIGDILQSIMEDLKPEAAYFAEIEGARGGYLVVNMDDPSQMPAIYSRAGHELLQLAQPTSTSGSSPSVAENRTFRLL